MLWLLLAVAVTVALPPPPKLAVAAALAVPDKQTVGVELGRVVELEEIVPSTPEAVGPPPLGVEA